MDEHELAPGERRKTTDTPTGGAGKWADLAKLLSRIVDRLTALEKRMDALELHSGIGYPPEEEQE